VTPRRALTFCEPTPKKQVHRMH